MGNELQLFSYSNQSVRTVTIEGEPWFVLADLCNILEIRNSRDVATRIRKADVGQTDIRSGGQMRSVTVVNESGMYDVVFRSDKPEALDFRYWITSEVIPSIRKTGAYSVAPAPSADVASITRRELALMVVAEADRADAAELKLGMVSRELEAAAPKLEAYDAVVDRGDCLTVRSAAQLLSNYPDIEIGATRLFDWLRDNGWIGKDNVAYHHRIKAGLMKQKHYRVYVHEDGSESVNPPQSLITLEGLEVIRKRLSKQRAERLEFDEMVDGFDQPVVQRSERRGLRSLNPEVPSYRR